MKTILRNIVACALLLSLALPQAEAQRRKVKKKKTVKTHQVKTPAKAEAPMIIYTETYGSVCCPRDPRWSKELFMDYVKRFNEAHRVRITEIYNETRGREGEQIFAVTLAELTPAQRMQFVEERIRDQSPEQRAEAMELLKHPKPVADFIHGDAQQLRIKL